MSTGISISGEQRNALYDRILLHLSGIDGVWLAVEQQDFQTAARLSQEFCDELRLVMDDLGWGEGRSGETIELTSPLDVVRRVIERLRADADGLDQEEEEIRATLRDKEEENRKVCEACDQILALIDDAKLAG